MYLKWRSTMHGRYSYQELILARINAQGRYELVRSFGDVTKKAVLKKLRMEKEALTIYPEAKFSSFVLSQKRKTV